MFCEVFIVARIISDIYEKGEKNLWDLNPDSLNNQEFNRKIVAVNEMYGWLYEKGILRQVSFEFKDYTDMSYFALDVKDLEPYREQMERCGIKDASLAVQHIFDKEYTPCIFSGAIQLGWTMLTYRDSGGNVGKSWETGIVKHLSGTETHKVSTLRNKKGVKAAVSMAFELYDFEPDLFNKACEYFINYVDLSYKENREFFNAHADKLIYCYENKKDMLDFDFWVQYEALLGEKITWDEYVAIDNKFDGDPHDVEENDIDTISGFRNSLKEHRNIITREKIDDMVVQKYCFDNWRDAAIIRKNLNTEQCELLHDILMNSDLIDNRPEGFDWSNGNYDLYNDGLFSVETSDKYKPFEHEILGILLVKESFEDDVSYLIDRVEDIFSEVNREFDGEHRDVIVITQEDMDEFAARGEARLKQEAKEDMQSLADKIKVAETCLSDNQSVKEFIFMPMDYEEAKNALLASKDDSMYWKNDGYACKLERGKDNEIYYDLHLVALPVGTTVMYGENVELVGESSGRVDIRVPNDGEHVVSINKEFFEKNFSPCPVPERDKIKENIDQER